MLKRQSYKARRQSDWRSRHSIVIVIDIHSDNIDNVCNDNGCGEVNCKPIGGQPRAEIFQVGTLNRACVRDGVAVRAHPWPRSKEKCKREGKLLCIDNKIYCGSILLLARGSALGGERKENCGACLEDMMNRWMMEGWHALMHLVMDLQVVLMKS